MSAKGTTGAASGRTGGRLGAAPRLRAALKSRPKLKVVGEVPQSSAAASGSFPLVLSRGMPPVGALQGIVAQAAKEAAENTLRQLMSNPAALQQLFAGAKAMARTPLSTGQSRRLARPPPKALPAPSPLQPTPKPSLATAPPCC